MSIQVKRIYDPASPGDGKRVLVDRLWPRGVGKAKAEVDLWLKEIAPSNALRRWYAHDAERWPEFRRRYFDELDAVPECVAALMFLAREGTVTLLFSSREARFNNAFALKDYLDKFGDRPLAGH